MTGQQDDERVEPPEVQSEEGRVDPPEVQAVNDALNNPNVPSSIADAARNMLKTRKDAEQAEEGEPKTKAERAYEKAKDDFLEEFSTVDENGKPKIPQNEGEALAEILAKALMALMTPLRMGAAALGMTQGKDDALDAMSNKAKEAANDLLAKMKNVYTKDDKKEELFETEQGNQTNEPLKEVDVEEEEEFRAHAGASPAPKPDLANDLDEKSRIAQDTAIGLLEAARRVAEKGEGGETSSLVNSSAASMIASYELQDAAGHVRGSTPELSSLSGKADAVRDSVLLPTPPGLTPNSDREAAKVNSASWKPATPTPTPKAPNPDEPHSDSKTKLT